ncbi:MAG: hypothetical protein IPN82_06900 [Chitinophagaceae bacterium]|nr:hypothetical protein [Chitinophagaceae bacterium]
MRLDTKYFCLLIIILLCSCIVVAQTDPVTSVPDSIAMQPTATIIEVGAIEITGNKKTKGFIILREIPFKTGDTYPLDVLVKKFEVGRQQLLNTSLFHAVTIAAKNFEGAKINVSITVIERWYLFPIPYFKPVDRNINQWIVEQKASLSRVNYGAKLLYNNVTGRNDNLRFNIINGYTKQLSFGYNRPYIDKKLKWGARVSFEAGKNKEINYNTVQNKQVFLKDEDKFTRRFIKAYAEVSFRKAIKARHSFGIGFNREMVSDTIALLNPSYFNSGRTSISFPEINYTFSYFDFDYIPYPTKGYAVQLSVGKKGFNKLLDVWGFEAKASASWPLSKKTFFNLTTVGSLKLPFKQPYFNQRILGYGDAYLQGYEYYVVDGVAGGVIKSTLAREFLNFKIKIPTKKGKEPERIPVRIFGKLYGNAGYAHNPQPGENSLSNKMLYSGGFGIDILTLYDVTFRLEYSFNAIGQNGLFLHRKTIF